MIDTSCKQFSIRYGRLIFGGFWKCKTRVEPSSTIWTIANSLKVLSCGVRWFECNIETSKDCLNFRKKRPSEAIHTGPDQPNPVSFSWNWTIINESSLAFLCFLIKLSKRLYSLFLLDPMCSCNGVFCPLLIWIICSISSFSSKISKKMSQNII